MYIYIYIYIYVCVCVCVYVCVYIYIYMCVCIYIYIYLKPPRVSHACGNISVMPECSNQRTSERAPLLAAMTHPSRVLNLDVKQSFVTPRDI